MRYEVGDQVEFFVSFEKGWVPVEVLKSFERSQSYLVKCGRRTFKVDEDWLGETHSKYQIRKNLLAQKSDLNQFKNVGGR